jgi:GTP pyrophosphokinase
MSEFGCLNKSELYQKISKQNIPLTDVENFVKKSVGNTIVRFWKLQFGGGDKNSSDSGDSDSINYELAGCCQPMPGDETIGIKADDDSCVFIHKKDCLYAAIKIKEHPLSLIPVSWKTTREQSSVAKITMEGIDQKGIAHKIITVVSQEFDLNLKTVNIETDGSCFSCLLEVYVRNQGHLEKLVNKLSGINGVLNIMVEGEEIY